METKSKSFLEKLNSEWVTPLFAIVAIIYGFIFKVNSDKLDQNTRTLANLQTQVNTELRQKEFDNNLKLTIYKEVKDAIENKDSAIQNATLIVVNEMLKDDTLFREKLKTVLFASSNSGKLIATQQKIDQFTAEQKSTPDDGFRIDVFYLDDNLGQLKNKAEQVVALLKNINPKYVIRLRLLPKEINAQSGYRVFTNQIRYESKESQIANAVFNAIVENKILKSEQFQLHITSYPTLNYISIFVSNG